MSEKIVPERERLSKQEAEEDLERLKEASEKIGLPLPNKLNSIDEVTALESLLEQEGLYSSVRPGELKDKDKVPDKISDETLKEKMRLKRAAKRYQFRLAFEKAGFTVTPQMIEECPEAHFEPLPEKAVDFSELLKTLSDKTGVSPAMASMPAYHLTEMLITPVVGWSIEKHEDYAIIQYGENAPICPSTSRTTYLIVSATNFERLASIAEHALVKMMPKGEGRSYEVVEKKGNRWMLSPKGLNQRKYRFYGDWMKKEKWPWFGKFFSRIGEQTGIFKI